MTADVSKNSLSRTISGIMHLHTTYSYDGTASLREMVKAVRKRGFNFLLLTEHSNKFGAEKMARLTADCQRLSKEDFVIIPGLEVDCDFGRHLLAIGINQYIGMGDPDAVVEGIRESGGLAIIPHPVIYQFRSFVTSVAMLNGVEVWNSRYDSKYAPNLRSFALLKNLQQENPQIFAYGGQDLHAVKKLDSLCLQLEVPSLTERDIMHCLERGRFRVKRNRTVIDASGEITRRQRLFFDLAFSAHLIGEMVWSSAKERK
jgi:hypothetical protein